MGLADDGDPLRPLLGVEGGELGLVAVGKGGLELARDDERFEGALFAHDVCVEAVGGGRVANLMRALELAQRPQAPPGVLLGGRKEERHDRVVELFHLHSVPGSAEHNV